MSESVDQICQGLVEEFGNIYEGYGLPRLNGLLVGLVLAHARPLSLDDMARLLNRSKGPISQAIRELALAGLVRKTNGKENRRDYYEADPDLFLNNFRRNMRTVAKNRSAADFFLEEIERRDIQDERLKANLQTMHDFYILMEQFYSRFEEEWTNSQRP